MHDIFLPLATPPKFWIFQNSISLLFARPVLNLTLFWIYPGFDILWFLLQVVADSFVQ